MRVFRAYPYKSAIGFGRKKTLIQEATWLTLLACLFLSIGLSKAHAQQPLMDYQVKAAMIYKFLGYSSWPENRFSDTHSPYRIWIIGSDNIKKELQEIVTQRLINNRPIEVYSALTADAVGDAHIVFVASNMEQQLPKLAVFAEQNSFMIITEHEQGLTTGSTINLRFVNQRIGFDISLTNAQNCGIVLSSRLLAIATSVNEERRQ